MSDDPVGDLIASRLRAIEEASMDPKERIATLSRQLAEAQAQLGAMREAIRTEASELIRAAAFLVRAGVPDRVGRKFPDLDLVERRFVIDGAMRARHAADRLLETLTPNAP